MGAHNADDLDDLGVSLTILTVNKFCDPAPEVDFLNVWRGQSGWSLILLGPTLNTLPLCPEVSISSCWGSFPASAAAIALAWNQIAQIHKRSDLMKNPCGIKICLKSCFKNHNSINGSKKSGNTGQQTSANLRHIPFCSFSCACSSDFWRWSWNFLPNSMQVLSHVSRKHSKAQVSNLNMLAYLYWFMPIYAHLC